MTCTVVALAADPLVRAELGGFLDELELLVLAELAPDDLTPEGLGELLDESTELGALVWAVDGTDTLLGTLPDVPLLALVSSPEDATYALRQGAAGVLGRDTDGKRLLAALGALTQGLAVLEPFTAQVKPQQVKNVLAWTARDVEVSRYHLVGYTLSFRRAVWNTV